MRRLEKENRDEKQRKQTKNKMSDLSPDILVINGLSTPIKR